MTLIVGHRGAAGLEPENTIGAFERAIELGVDAVEFDVRAAADGPLVVIHDDTVDRTTDGTGPVAAHTVDELRALDAGDGRSIPTLGDALDALAGTDVRLHVDLKVAGVGERTLRVLRERGLLSRATVFSSLPGAVEELEAGDARLGLSVREVTDDALDLAADLGVAFLLGPGRPDAEAVRRARAAGFDPGVSTVNDPAAIRRALALDPHSVLTDRPDRAVALHR